MTRDQITRAMELEAAILDVLANDIALGWSKTMEHAFNAYEATQGRIEALQHLLNVHDAWNKPPETKAEEGEVP